MENRKVRNASKFEYNGITFKSKFEVTVYKTLVEKYKDVRYEKHTIVLVKPFTPTVPFYKHDARRGFKQDKATVRPITYTPDFVVVKNRDLLVFEAKGFPNDIYPVKRKLFRAYLEGVKARNIFNRIYFFEVKSKRDLIDAINVVESDERAEKISEGNQLAGN